MVGPAVPEVIIAAIRSPVLRELSLTFGGTLAAGAILKNFDKTSKNICACLDKIDRTLIDGFAGRDIESERLKETLSETNKSITEIAKALKFEETRGKDAAVATTRNPKIDGDFALKENLRRRNEFAGLLVELENKKQDLERQIEERNRELANERKQNIPGPSLRLEEQLKSLTIGGSNSTGINI